MRQRWISINRYSALSPKCRVLPTVTKVFEVCNRPATSSHNLNGSSPWITVLTGRVMNLVDSAYYSLGKEVTSLIHAIILLGLNTVKNLA